MRQFHGVIIKTNGISIATSILRAVYNLLANFSDNVVPVDRLKEKAGKDIGKCTDFLEASPKTLLTHCDI